MKKILIVAIFITIVALIILINNNKLKTPTNEDILSAQIPDTDGFEVETADPISPGIYTLDLDKSNILWAGYGVGKQHSGKFDDIKGEITATADNTLSGNIEIAINSLVVEDPGPGSLNNNLTSHLLSADFFDAPNFPLASFTFDNVIISKTQNLIEGNLTIKGITKAITLGTVFDNTDNSINFTGTTTIDRTDWNVMFGSDSLIGTLKENVINDEVDIVFTLNFEK